MLATKRLLCSSGLVLAVLSGMILSQSAVLVSSAGADEVSAGTEKKLPPLQLSIDRNEVDLESPFRHRAAAFVGGVLPSVSLEAPSGLRTSIDWLMRMSWPGGRGGKPSRKVRTPQSTVVANGHPR